MRTRSLILFMVLVARTGCVVMYRDFRNMTLESIPKDQEPKPLYYYVDPILSRLYKNKERVRFHEIELMLLLPDWYPVSAVDPPGQPGHCRAVAAVDHGPGQNGVHTLVHRI